MSITLRLDGSQSPRTVDEMRDAIDAAAEDIAARPLRCTPDGTPTDDELERVRLQVLAAAGGYSWLRVRVTWDAATRAIGGDIWDVREHGEKGPER